MSLLKKTTPVTNCLNLQPNFTFTVGLPTQTSHDGSRGVVLMRRDEIVPFSRETPPETDEEHRMSFGWYACSHDLRGKSGAMPSQVIVRVRGLRAVEQLHGQAPALSVNAEGHESAARRISFGRHAPTALLCLTWPREVGRFSDVPAILLETRGCQPSVIGLTAANRDIHGIPNLWRRSLHDYRRIMAESAERLDEALQYRY